MEHSYYAKVVITIRPILILVAVFGTFILKRYILTNSFINLEKIADNTILVFDHDFGGGTELFRTRMLDEYLQQNWCVLLVVSKDQIKQKAIQIFQYYKNDVSETGLMESTTVFELLYNIKPEIIYINSIVSFRPFIIFIKELYEFLCEQSNANIKVAIHDYYPVCPSLNLLNYQWNFCGVPEEAECIKCRNKHRSGSLKEPNIADWRNTWIKIFKLSSQIIIFSESSKAIMLKAFPDSSTKLLLQPHSMSYFKPGKTFSSPHKPMHIGIVGHISREKGATIVESMSDYLQTHAPEIEISIFGNIDIKNNKDNIKVLGKYEINDLPTLIEEQNITVFLMPSICPETFSYVTHELMMMKCPVVAFNLGAQGEAIKPYERGAVVEPNISSKELYKVLRRLSTEGEL